MHVYVKNVNEMTGILCNQGFFFLTPPKNIISKLTMLPLKLLHSLQTVENQFGHIYE